MAQEMSGFLEELLTAPDPFQGAAGPADSMRMVDFIAYADDRIRNDLTDRPATRARMLTVLGRVHQNLGYPDRAVTTLRDAAVANQEVFGPGAEETVQALRSLGFVLSESGSAAEGEDVLREALEGQITLTGARSLEVASIQELLARGLLDRRRIDEAEPLLRAAYETRRDLLGDSAAAVAQTLNALAAAASFAGDDEGALGWMEEAVAVFERAGPDQRPNLGITLGNLGGLYRRLGRLDDAQASLTRGLGILREFLGPDHFLTAGAEAQLAAVSAQMGRYGEADSLWSSAIATLERVTPGAVPVAGEQGAWARSLREQGRLSEAESRIRSGIEAARRIQGPPHPLLALNTAILGDILRDQGRLREADSAYGSALEAITALPAHDPNVIGVRIARAELWERMGQVGEAEGALRETHATAEGALGRGHPMERRAAGALVAFLERQERGGEADAFR